MVLCVCPLYRAERGQEKYSDSIVIMHRKAKLAENRSVNGLIVEILRKAELDREKRRTDYRRAEHHDGVLD